MAEVVKEVIFYEASRSALTLFVARPFFVDYVDTPPPFDDLIVRTDLFYRGAHFHELWLSAFPNDKFTTRVNLELLRFAQ